MEKTLKCWFHPHDFKIIHWPQIFDYHFVDGSIDILDYIGGFIDKWDYIGSFIDTQNYDCGVYHVAGGYIDAWDYIGGLVDTQDYIWGFIDMGDESLQSAPV